MVCHMYGAMPLFAMPCICRLEYEKQTSYIGLEYMGRQYHQIRGIRVTKDWYFSIILNSSPMIFHSLWIKGEFTIFDLQLNFLARFDERKIFEPCFLMQNP